MPNYEYRMAEVQVLKRITPVTGEMNGSSLIMGLCNISETCISILAKTLSRAMISKVLGVSRQDS